MAYFVKWSRFYPLVRLIGAVAIAWMITKFPLNFIEGALYDARIKLSPSPHFSEKIELVSIDAKTLSAIKHDPTVKDQTELLRQIRAEKPLAITFLNDPGRWEGTPEEKTEFVETAKASPHLFFATDQISPVSSYAKLRLSEPFEELNLVSAPITRDNISFAGDKVSRRLLVSFEDDPTLQAKLASLVNPNVLRPHSIRGSYEADSSRLAFIRYAPAGSFKPWSLVDIRDGRFPRGTFTGKIVLIGNDNQADSDDYILTPYSKDPLAMSRLEANADIINTLIENNGYIKLNGVWDLIFTAIVAYITVLIVWSVRPLKGITLLVAQGLGFTAFAYLLFAVLGIWINMTHPLIAIFVSYYFFIPYRLIAENRRSWEFEQKNRLLTQVEELKTNFMSMMSHDLKTPLARIHGMAEAALNDSSRLADSQKTALNTIIQSSDQLSGFIGSILDLSRIEAKAIKLHRSTRDVNTLIDEVINKYEFLAQTKNILFHRAMEPLFSIKIDADLIRQVIGNLVENAIKYSPDNSIVTIRSREVDGHILITIEDQGRGIPQDEIDNVFLKFYRSKQVNSSSIKGTGLGLYLAKYFVELHDGTIRLESEPNKGSQFTIDLPT